MTQFPRLSALLLISGILAVPAVVRGDTIHITSGALASRSNDLGVVEVTMASPDHGFSLSAVADAGGGIYDLYNLCVRSAECMPGRLLPLQAAWSGSDFIGTVTADGLTVGVGLLSEITAAADADFKGTWTPPPFTGHTTASVTAPFTFTGLVDYPQVRPGDPNPFTRTQDQLVGLGLATINLAWVAGNTQSGAWTYTGARYEFTATPEPATLLLVAPCVLGLTDWRKANRVAHGWLRRRSPSDSSTT